MGLSDKAFNADNSKELASIGINPKPFPYWPPQATEEELKRGEVMMELNKWANNDQEIARRTASTLIFLLAKQFEIDLKEIK